MREKALGEHPEVIALLHTSRSTMNVHAKRDSCFATFVHPGSRPQVEAVEQPLGDLLRRSVLPAPLA